MGRAVAARRRRGDAPQLAVERAVLVERADEVHLGEAHGIARQHVVDHRHVLAALLLGRQPPEGPGERDHARAQRRLPLHAQRGEIARPGRIVGRHLGQRLRECGRAAVRLGERGESLLDPAEVRLGRGGIFAQQPVHEAHLPRGVLALVEEAADLAALGRQRLRTAHARYPDHRIAPEHLQQARVGAPAAEIAAAATVEVAVDEHSCRGTHRRRGREPVDRRHVREDAPHAVAAALPVGGGVAPASRDSGFRSRRGKPPSAARRDSGQEALQEARSSSSISRNSLRSSRSE